ncbi:hypothetical protein ECEPECA12_1071 [Escherichia coli EPECa12]|nr:hypothetical protein ECTX1999_3644 [Escherichia coli TX1999]EHV81410.1 hypothetical protein ECDEC7C_5424 [Escherichia coli DEC7C]EHV82784.1 hypothetical protein ECDEC7A_5202 [Escherichia coli DEC7A]EHV93685.1 hypothetical protein ECDEC7E_5137 [Escherichia coli DEC7E]EIQ66011.1 hypothetical protein ECEPECA12_1071 [Escherichia coli EPECa12]
MPKIASSWQNHNESPSWGRVKNVTLNRVGSLAAAACHGLKLPL